MRQGLRPAFVAAGLVLVAATGCSPGHGTPAARTASAVSAAPSAVSAAPSATDAAVRPVVSSLTPELIASVDRTRALLMKSEEGEPTAPDPERLMLAQVWPQGAAYVWELLDQRVCSATVRDDVVEVRGCNVHPVDPPIASPAGVHTRGTLFTDGWVQLIGADHQEVTGAMCGTEPLEVHRVGTIAGGVRTLYTVRFPNYTKGSMTLLLDHDGVASRDTLPLGEVGDRTCTPVS